MKKIVASLSVLLCALSLSQAQVSQAQVSQAQVSLAQVSQAQVNQAQVNQIVNSAEPVNTIAFGSCFRETRAAPIFDTIFKAAPDVFIFLGDNGYIDPTDQSMLDAGYARLGQIPALKNLMTQTKVLATWDDHEFGINDAGKENPIKIESQKAFLDFWGDAPNSARRGRPGVYESYSFGPEGRRVQVILLDTRYFRDALEIAPDVKPKTYVSSTNPAATILGREQWAWLEEQMKQPCDVRIIASSIQVIPQEHRFEKWLNFPLEQKRLFDLIGKTQTADSTTRTILISGDRHSGEFSVAKDVSPKPIYEVTSSSLNNSSGKFKQEPNRYRQGPLITVNHFALMRFDWASKAVVVELVGEDGTVLSSMKID